MEEDRSFSMKDVAMIVALGVCLVALYFLNDKTNNLSKELAEKEKVVDNKIIEMQKSLKDDIEKMERLKAEIIESSKIKDRQIDEAVTLALNRAIEDHKRKLAESAAAAKAAAGRK